MTTAAMSETTQQARESRAVMRSARYAAPQPITAIVSVAGARVRIAASDRTDTVVQVEPVNQASRTDMKVAARTKVDFTGGQLTVKTTTSGKKHGSVAITIDLPNGSNLVAYLAHSSVHADGSLADCELHVASDRVRLDRVGTLQANVGAGEVAVGHVAGPAKIESRSGQINIEHASADLELSNGSGAFDIERVDGNVTAMTGSGAIRIGMMTSGHAELMNASGNIEVGISDASAACIDVNSERGSVSSPSDTGRAETRGTPESKVSIHARTRHGDIVIQRVAR